VADRRIAMEEGRVVAIVAREAATGGEDVE
jgi:hypothetical protein